MKHKKEKKMFNSEQKQAYIDYEVSNNQILTNYFKRISESEKNLNKDIADMDIDELKNTISALNIRQEITKSHFISLLRGYATWARLHGKTNNEAIFLVNAESVDSKHAIKMQMIKSEEEFREILKRSEEYKDYFNRTTRNELICWLLYYGLTVQELLVLKKTDIDYETNTVITGNGKRYKVMDEIAKKWKHCCEMTTLEKKNSVSENPRNSSFNEYISYTLVDNDYLFRPTDGDNKIRQQFSKSTLLSIISKTFPKDKKQVTGISPLSIRDSGIFYRLYLTEKEGADITPELIAERFGINFKSKEELYMKTRTKRISYEDWKIAFDYV